MRALGLRPRTPIGLAASSTPSRSSEPPEIRDTVIQRVSNAPTPEGTSWVSRVTRSSTSI
ncbi:hypothetical protein SNL152K_5563 [Streptomyces sp. NL15-2K]|nr:hypothetical protein SNL152K_5563 [Streptomyces sp. NL15-2K]